MFIKKLQRWRGQVTAARMLSPAAETGMSGNVPQVVKMRERTVPGLH